MANPDAGDAATMRAVVIDSFGGPEQLRERQVPVPSPGPGQVLIRLESAGVGSWDPFEREGATPRCRARRRRFPTCWAPKGPGARVLAVASGEDGVALAARAGADQSIDGRAEQVAEGARRFSADGLDAALLTAGGPEADAGVATVRPGGRAAYPTGVQPEPGSTPAVEPQAFNGEPDAELLDASWR